MKTYEEYKKEENYFNLGQLSVYNDFITSNNLKPDYKIWDGAIFLLLAHTNVDELLAEDFKDYKSYFDIILLESNVVKSDNNHLFNAYQLKLKE
ncbi:hypothetical protein [Sphingobacterium rhinopitheci]|uniref:hypothetical protein n=1 Tax=Sphingobacterium rhinopitheci TaxID=2781960 RepID=UPI001F525C3A|nr:hypothetical protein [Sphingobacterium rhinopitheci]MCI0919846.1 hypothetical protein [Sphingobacterium rhinopitheci]